MCFGEAMTIWRVFFRIGLKRNIVSNNSDFMGSTNRQPKDGCSNPTPALNVLIVD